MPIEKLSHGTFSYKQKLLKAFDTFNVNTRFENWYKNYYCKSLTAN